jgi:hypothetical protein
MLFRRPACEWTSELVGLAFTPERPGSEVFFPLLASFSIDFGCVPPDLWWTSGGRQLFYRRVTERGILQSTVNGMGRFGRLR